METLIKILSVCVFGSLANANKHFESHQLKSGDTMNIWPITNECHTESRWNFEACEGCKIVLSCVLLRRSCADHMLTVFNGQWTSRHCGPNDSYLLKTSHRNWMNVIIENYGMKPGSYCHVSVTKPFYNEKYISIDSSEHGLGTEARRLPSCKCGWANKIRGRIVGGKTTSPNEYPFVALLMLKKKKVPFCGATIITPYHVVTAAHCTNPFHDVELTVVVGEHDVSTYKETPFTKLFDVDTAHEHPKYQNNSKIHDISILKLKYKIKFNDAVGPACLPKGTTNSLDGGYLKVLGWGQVKYNGPMSPVLRKVNIKVIDLDICKTIYGGAVDGKKRSQICTWAPERDSCQGDSGGPLVWRDPETNRFTLVGVVSFARECGHTDPGVNTNISFYMDWIKKTIAAGRYEEICN